MVVDPRLIDTRPTEAQVRRSLRYKKCVKHPEGRLEVGLDSEGTYIPICVQCRREGSDGVLGEYDPRYEQGRRLMTQTQALAPLTERLNQLQKIDVKQVRLLLAFGPDITDDHIRQYLGYAQAVQADPWAKEIYLIPFKNSPPAIILSVNWYLKRASLNPLYESYLSGIVVYKDGQEVERKGSLMYGGETLVGGWCKVFKKGATHPFEHRVSLAYLKKEGRSQWDSPDKQAFMVEKGAISQGIRRAFPTQFGPETAGPFQVVDESVAEIPERAPAVSPNLAPAMRRTLAPPSGAADNGNYPCPIHQEEVFTEKRNKNGRFYSHKQEDGWCADSSKPVRDVWALATSGLFTILDVTEQSKKMEWLAANCPGLPPSVRDWRAPDYCKVIAQLTTVVASAQEAAANAQGDASEGEGVSPREGEGTQTAPAGKAAQGRMV